MSRGGPKWKRACCRFQSQGYTFIEAKRSSSYHSSSSASSMNAADCQAPKRSSGRAFWAHFPAEKCAIQPYGKNAKKRGKTRKNKKKRGTTRKNKKKHDLAQNGYKKKREKTRFGTFLVSKMAQISLREKKRKKRKTRKNRR